MQHPDKRTAIGDHSRGDWLMECPLSQEELVELVREEARLRTSPEFMRQVEEEERDGRSDGTVAIRRMQEDLVTKAGHPAEMVEVLRSARLWFPSVQELWEIPVQVRYNTLAKGSLELGDLVPRVTLFYLNGIDKTLFEGCQSGIHVVLAGSYS